MPIRALSIDFWNTLVVAQAGGEARGAQRREQVARVVAACAAPCSSETVAHAFETAAAAFDRLWRTQHQTPPTATLVQLIWETLGVDVPEKLHAETVRVFEDGILHGAPTLADGAAEALAWASSRYRLAVLSDTMFSPGRVIRKLLERHGVLRYFDAFAFSDETGFAKPDLGAYEQVSSALETPLAHIVHIGDLRRTDVAGAVAAGAGAVLYRGVRADTGPGPAPHATLDHWNDLPSLLAELDQNRPPAADG